MVACNRALWELNNLSMCGWLQVNEWERICLCMCCVLCAWIWIENHKWKMSFLFGWGILLLFFLSLWLWFCFIIMCEWNVCRLPVLQLEQPFNKLNKMYESIFFLFRNKKKERKTENRNRMHDTKWQYSLCVLQFLLLRDIRYGLYVSYCRVLRKQISLEGG